MKPIIPILLIGIIMFASLINCDSAKHNSGKYILLESWEVNIGKGWTNVSPVPWEWSVEKGGIAAKDYDGFGEYRITFTLPDDMKNMNLAFFTDCIDDADIAYLNGREIGETGRVPRNIEDIKNGNFMSAARIARLYIIPKDLLKYNSENTLKLRVYDYSGNGGFGYSQKPVICPYKQLAKKARLQRDLNDIPRIIVQTFQIIVLTILIYNLILIGSRENYRYAFRKLMHSLNIFAFYKGNVPEILTNQNISAEFIFRYLLSIFTNLMFFLFFLSELTFKYYLIESELFWFKVSPIALYSGFVLSIIIFHNETFGLVFNNKKKNTVSYIRLLLALISHPFISSFIIFYLSILPPGKAWSEFTSIGTYFIFLILNILFIASIINLIKASYTSIDKDYSRILRREGIIRIVFFIIVITSITLFISSTSVLMAQGAMIIIFSFLISVLMSVSFYIRYRIEMPVKLNKQLNERLAKYNKKEISVTTEKYMDIIISYLDENYIADISREGLASKVDMSPDHLSRMFKQYTGKKISEYINELRIKKAVRRLQDTDEEVIRIAHDVGFESLRTFNRVFLQFTGKTPSQYRLVNFN